jgi:hypothetical protein
MTEIGGCFHGLVMSQGLVLRDIESFIFEVSILQGNGSASISGAYLTTNSKVKSQDSDDMYNSKTSAADEHQEDSASNGINEETS